MPNRRQFLKSILVAAVSAPLVVRAAIDKPAPIPKQEGIYHMLQQNITDLKDAALEESLEELYATNSHALDAKRYATESVTLMGTPSAIARIKQAIEAERRTIRRSHPFA
jgi:hypothetical protein